MTTKEEAQEEIERLLESPEGKALTGGEIKEILMESIRDSSAIEKLNPFYKFLRDIEKENPALGTRVIDWIKMIKILKGRLKKH